MKHFILATIAVFTFCTIATAQTTYQDGDNVHLWGSIQLEDLLDAPYTDWYYKSDSVYSPSLEKRLYSNLDDVRVKIFLGTWCGDTKNYLPKFIKLWKYVGLPMEHLEFVALHNSGDLYKQGPNREEADYDVHRVPTFVFERNGEELARIVEHPVTSLDVDLAQIANGIPPRHAYYGIRLLQDFFKNNAPTSVDSIDKEFLRGIMRNTSYVGELTTYARKLDADGHTDQAEMVYKLNTRLFRYHPYSYYRLGKFHLDQDKLDLAQENFIKTLEIAPDYLSTCEYLFQIKESKSAIE